MNIIILGSGRLGSRLANSLVQKGHKIVIVDAEETKFKNLEEHEKIQRVSGNIFNEETASLVFSEQADVFIAVTGSDNVNLMVAQAMQKKYKIPRVLIRVFDPTLSSVYHDLGMETVCPTNFALQEMLKTLEKGV
ncbi:MAG: TrkA family potassium uptake protein [Nitrospirae bacterium]|nr:TrkA family potassium uptake protein [Candidatus Manganitrophaceae bacterium]